MYPVATPSETELNATETTLFATETTIIRLRPHYLQLSVEASE
jgi:hypothetical protein